MTLNRSLLSSAVLAASMTLCATSQAAFAADPPATPAVEAPTAPAPSAATSAPKFLSLSEIETRLAAQGIRVHEMEVHDKVLEVEGYSTQDGKVELIVDRRNGEILSRQRDD